LDSIQKERSLWRFNRLLHSIEFHLAAAGIRVSLDLHGLGWLPRQTHEVGSLLDNTHLARKDG
jgi:hypothetical protein